MPRQPAVGRQPQPSLLFLVHHLEWITEPVPALLLDLAKDQATPAPHDDVELVAAGPGIPLQDAVAAQPVPPDGAPLGGPA